MSGHDNEPRFLSVSALKQQTVSWLWPGRLALGKLALLEGDPGLGKSLVALDLCARLSRGAALPDGAPACVAGRSLILNAEDGDSDTVRSRLIGLDADLGRIFVMDTQGPAGGILRLPAQVEILDDAMTRIGPRLVVIDPWVAFLEPRLATGNDQCIRQVAAALARLAASHNCVILLVRHLNKSGARQAIYRGAGSIGLVGACRSAWLVGRDPGDPQQCVLAQVKNNLAAPQPSLAYRVQAEPPGPPRLTWLGGSPWNADQVAGGLGRGAARLRARALLQTLLGEGPRTSREIWSQAQKQGLSERTLRRARKELQIETVRGVVQGRQQTYLRFKGQQLPPDVRVPADECDLEPWLAPLREMYPPSTPLDEE